MPENIKDAQEFTTRQSALDEVARRKAKAAAIAAQVVKGRVKVDPPPPAPEIGAAEQQLRTEREMLSGLLEKQAATQLDAEARIRERSKIAYIAITGGDEAARSRLGQLHLEIIRNDSVLASLESAIAEAHVRVSDAEEALRAAEGGQNATQALHLLATLRTHGEQLDGAAQALVDGYHRLRDVLRQLRSLGFQHPAERLTAAASRRALQASLAQSDLEWGELLRPAERHSFKQITAGWAASIESEARAQGAEVLRLLTAGMGKAAIARQLGIGERSVYRIAAGR